MYCSFMQHAPLCVASSSGSTREFESEYSHSQFSTRVCFTITHVSRTSSFAVLACRFACHVSRSHSFVNLRLNGTVDAKLQIGFLTKQKSMFLFKEVDAPEQDIKKFYLGVRAFFETATACSLQNLPHKHDVLKNAGFVTLEIKMSADQLHAVFLVLRYICVMLAL